MFSTSSTKASIYIKECNSEKKTVSAVVAPVLNGNRLKSKSKMSQYASNFKLQFVMWIDIINEIDVDFHAYSILYSPHITSNAYNTAME